MAASNQTFTNDNNNNRNNKSSIAGSNNNVYEPIQLATNSDGSLTGSAYGNSGTQNHNGADVAVATNATTDANAADYKCVSRQTTAF